MWYSASYHFTADPQHGLGILFGGSGAARVFWEDGTLEPATEDMDRDDALDCLGRFADSRWNQFSASEQAQLKELFENGTCVFSRGKDGSLTVDLTLGKKTWHMVVAKSRYSYDLVCSCAHPRCVHMNASAVILHHRLQALRHAYVTTALAVDKSLFLEDQLEKALLDLNIDKLDQNMIRNVRSIITMLDSADSPAYYRLFHEGLLSLAPRFYDYEAKFLEQDYDYFLLALFEDPGYTRAVIEPGDYADPAYYEGRQRRSNRACFKRILKEYGKVVKEMDRQDNYEQDTYKELLLKFRDDLPGLLRYYAEGKETLDLFDMPFIERIAALPDLNEEHICAAAAKIDPLHDKPEAVQAFRHLIQRLPGERKNQLYQSLQNLTMPMEEIRQLPAGEQKKLVNNIPLSTESFCFILDNLLSQSSPAEKGRFILRAVKRLLTSTDSALHKLVAEKTALLPDSRLLLAYVIVRLRVKGKFTAPPGDPEKELTTYFDAGYRIVNEQTRYYTEFSITVPETDICLLTFEEENGQFRRIRCDFQSIEYPPELIRRICLNGKEEAYNKACIENREAVDIFLFEKNNRKFASGYRQLCDSLKDEKYLFTESVKAGIDWLVYREAGSSTALAFKVGHNKKYVVKDAPEFIKAFKTGQTTSYGKDLILTHETDNLIDTDADIIKLLMAAKYTKGRPSDKGNKRYITVADSVWASMLEQLTGRMIWYNDMPCQVRMDARKVRLRISSGYVSSTDIDAGTQEFWNLVGRGYLLTLDKKAGGAYIDRVNGTAEEANLIEFVQNNPGICIRPILADFKKNIYSRFFEMIDVDKAVQSDFRLSEIRLNTYFDFEKDMITARTAIFREGVEVSSASLTERIDQVKLELLQNYLSALGFSDGVLEDESHILAFFKLDFTRLKSLTNVYLSENLQNKELRSVSRPVIRVAYSNNLVNVFLEKSEFSEEELAQILAGIRKKKKFILMGGNRIIDLDSEAARDFGEAVTDFGMNPKDLYKKKTVSMITAIKAFSHERSCRVDKYLRDMIEEIRTFKEADISVPKLTGELRPYQEEGYKWMSILARYGMGGILADDMGLGKTIQVIALLKSDLTRKPSLVVCPKSLIFNWVNEFARFDPKTSVTAIYGLDSKRTELIGAIDYKKKAVYITSYDSLRNDIDKYTGQFNYGILDEAQYIKNVHALKTKSVKELNVTHRFALTGTPIENSVVDLWSIFDYIMPGYFEELSRFKDSDTAAIARKSAPFILRRVKEDVLEDLPPKYERILSADMSAGQRRIYEAMRLEAREKLETGGKAFDMLPYLTRLRQVCVDPGMFLEGYDKGSGKMEMLASLIPEYLEAGHRILIFSQFVKALEAVDHLLRGLGISTYFLSGATAAKDRIEMMDSFNNGSGTDVFLISLKAGGTGLNLTGADTVIHLDPWWNVAAENQASDRTHRIGQTRNVEVIKLIASDSIEQRVVELQDIKKEVIRQVISDDDGSVTSASLEDIAFVLGSGPGNKL